MNDLATHLCDEVLPEVPMRQWVCSPFGLRYVMGYDRELYAAVLDAFIGALSRSPLERAGRSLETDARAADDGSTLGITTVQRVKGAVWQVEGDVFELHVAHTRAVRFDGHAHLQSMLSNQHRLLGEDTRHRALP
jgi:hypothetical protein